MTRTRIALLAAGLFFTGPMLAAHAADQPQAALENSVVKIFSTMRYPDPFKPWTKQAPSEATASGVVIEGKRILTNAHVVAYATQIYVQPHRSADRLPAKVILSALPARCGWPETKTRRQTGMELAFRVIIKYALAVSFMLVVIEV